MLIVIYYNREDKWRWHLTIWAFGSDSKIRYFSDLQGKNGDRDPELLSKNPQKSDFTFCDRVFRSNKWVRLRAGLCNEKPRNAKNDPKLSKLSKCCRTDTKMCNTVQVVSLVVLGLQESSSRWKMCPYSLESRITGISRKIFVSSIQQHLCHDHRILIPGCCCSNAEHLIYKLMMFCFICSHFLLYWSEIRKQ